MDPGVQGLAGALAALACRKNSEKPLSVFIAGFLAGLLADADVFIRSSTDPLLFLEYHRQFTHSLLFIPAGGAISAVMLFPFFKRQFNFLRLCFLTTAAYATHGLIDTCTSYGTQLLWPDNTRYTWNVISIVDPLVTLILLFFAVMAMRRGAPSARLGIVCVLLYFCFGLLQRERATLFIEQIAASRGHQLTRLEVKPSIFNLLVFRSVYFNGQAWQVDGVRTGLFSQPKLYAGSSVEPYQSSGSNLSNRQLKDIERFNWFSNGYLYRHPDKPEVIADLRFALLPDETVPLWGIVIDSARPDRHVDFQTFRNVDSTKWEKLWAMIAGNDLHE